MNIDKCKYNDCGWCYAPDDKDSNDKSGQCLKPSACKEYENQRLSSYKEAFSKEWDEIPPVGREIL